MAETAVTHAPAAEHGVEPTFLGVGAAWFVSAAMVAVILLLLWKRVPAAIGRALDRKIEAIRAQLAEAERLRADAEALKAEYEAKAAAADKDRETILERARHEAEGIVAQAKADTAALIERRTRMAEDKIAAAERHAIEEVRARAAAAATAAAASLISENIDAAADRTMVDRTIADLSTKP
jgi:F-type H+-transporting ATPase subunit b